MRRLFVTALALASLSAAQGKQTLTGTITDEMCAKADHSQMQMGPTDAECTKECVRLHGASYVLFDGSNVFRLSNQDTPAKFAAQKVRVTGVLDAKTKTIHVESITAGG